MEVDREVGKLRDKLISEIMKEMEILRRMTATDQRTTPFILRLSWQSLGGKGPREGCSETSPSRTIILTTKHSACM